MFSRGRSSREGVWTGRSNRQPGQGYRRRSDNNRNSSSSSSSSSRRTWNDNVKQGSGDSKKNGSWNKNTKKSNNWDKSGSWKKRKTASKEFLEALSEQRNEVDEKFGFSVFDSGEPRLGWLLNMSPTVVSHMRDENVVERAALECYFLQQDGTTFKSHVLHRPYFYVIVKERFVMEVKAMLEKRFVGRVDEIRIVEKEDLDMGNHLTGSKAKCLQFFFNTVSELSLVKSELLPIVKANLARTSVESFELDANAVPEDLMATLEDMREYDVRYYTRVSIDLSINVGSWYIVKPRFQDGLNVVSGLGVVVEKQEIVEKAEPGVLAFDIECTKEPLKFPNVETDQIFMISYMFDGQGYLIINREVFMEDVEDFEYTPKPEFPGPFQVFNVENEKMVIEKFFQHCSELKPKIWVTYNGDFFDWPFIERRAQLYDMDMFVEIGVRKNNQGEYTGRCCVHMDCMYWVKRDSYLPAGSRGLKAVTKAKLGYDPVEVDPEDMVRMAQQEPNEMAAYSVSDAVATYYLYDKYINLFVFSLCTIIPMGPDDVLRKGSGTLCEMLLMVEAKRGNIVCPNKQVELDQKYTADGHLLESETYIGGHVECLETGVYRKDIPEKFKLDPDAFDELIANIDRDLTFAIEVETGIPRREVVNYDTVRGLIIEELELLRDNPTRSENPTIYHLDVAAMYPNIILTNRLQPCAIVEESDCSLCVHNRGPDSDCKRRLDWEWRGEYAPASRGDIKGITAQLESETFEDGKRFYQLDNEEKDRLLRSRVKLMCQRTYGKQKITKVEKRQATVCQRENPFYVNTVKAFRDRRYEYKGLTKKWAKKKSAFQGDELPETLEKLAEATNKVLLYDSLQLAHKCILNSFYGYVMRRGARWHSMEMAGIVTHFGGNIIKQARRLVERVGRPLELDTDGIWCILPKSFPENFTFKTASGGKINISYPCVMLNADVHATFTNDQYQNLVPGSKGRYEMHSECSIYFEVDGPYRCMVLPASQEEGKLLKKRYAVFNDDGSLAELKGFELKRRGELKITKIFQAQVFEKFLDGSSLQECYQAVGEIANYWLDVLFTHGKDLTDDEVIDLISENRSMSRSLEDYGDQKSLSITCAKRLGDFLGENLTSRAGLQTKLLISKQPVGSPVTERSIPTVIFSADEAVKRDKLRTWLKNKSITDFDVRSIIDWDYYIERFGNTIRKIITIPAALQNIANPVPRLQHPVWLLKAVRDKLDPYQQASISGMFKKILKANNNTVRKPCTTTRDIEDLFCDPAKEPKQKEKSVAIVAVGDAEKQEKTVVDDFSSWLTARKKKWAMIREQYKSNPEKVLKSNTLTDFVTATKQKLLDHWQILEVRELKRLPGRFKVFFLSAPDKMQTIYLDIPRVFFVNSIPSLNVEKDTLPPNAVVEKVSNRSLPHSHREQQLYRVTLPEADFQRNAKQVANFVCRPEHLGVYELQVPLVSRVVNTLGCVAKVFDLKGRLRRGVSSKHFGSLKDPFQLSDFGRLNETQYPYLRQETGAFKRMFCFNAGIGGRQVVVLFEIEETSDVMEERCLQSIQLLKEKDTITGEEDLDLLQSVASTPKQASCHMWISTEVGGGQSRPNLKRFMQEVIAGLEDPSINPAEYSLTNVKVVSCPTVQSCWDGLDGVLQAKARAGLSEMPTFIIIQSTTSRDNVLEAAPSLGAFPCVWPAAHKEDDTLPALLWEQELGKHAVRRYFSHSMWLHKRVRAARYGHLPLGHVGEDLALSIADMQLMHHLVYNSHVLWASPASLPDIGGVEADVAHLDVIDTLYQGKGGDNSVTLKPGTYRSICAQINVFHLAIHTVLHAALICDFEGGNGESLALDSSKQTSLDPATGQCAEASQIAVGLAEECKEQFRILQVMVRNWFQHVCSAEDNEIPDLLLVHFYRWLCSPQSLFFDPTMFNYVHQMMGKVFRKLCDKLHELGAKVIFASFQKVWICTQRNTMDAARVFCDHIIQSIKNIPLFQDLHFETAEFWQTLVFMDEENYGGIQDNEFYDGRDEEEEEDNKGKLKVDGEEADDVIGGSSEKEDMEIEGKVPVVGRLDQEDVEMEVEGNTDAIGSSSKKGIVENDDVDVKMEWVEQPQEALSGTEDELSRPKTKRKLVPKAPGDPSKTVRPVDPDFDPSDDGVDDEPVATTSNKKGLRKRRADGLIDFGTRKSSLAAEQERVRRLKAGYDSDDESDDNVSDSERKKSLNNLDDFIVRDAEDDFYEDDDELAKQANASIEPESQEEVKPTGKYVINVHFNMVHHLPHELMRLFEEIVGEFLLQPLKYRDSWYKELLKNEEDGTWNDALVTMDSDELTASRREYVRDLVRNTLMEGLLKLAPQIMARSKTGLDVFPKLAGSYLSLTNPALEFVKMVCHILSLDPDVEDEVLILRRSLLKLIQVGEFTDEAAFKNPSLVLVVHDVVCSYCNYCTDLDLCRNLNLMNEDAFDEDGVPLWSCPECRRHYDIPPIEIVLVQRVQTLCVGFQLQDLSCVKCGDTRNTLMSDCCKCSGTWDFSIPVTKQKDTLLPYKKVAQFYKLEWLEETCHTAEAYLR